MNESRWRNESAEVIAAVLAALPPGSTTVEKRKAVSAAYPFGPRAHHPYRIWYSEVRRVLGSNKKTEGLFQRMDG